MLLFRLYECYHHGSIVSFGVVLSVHHRWQWGRYHIILCLLLGFLFPAGYLVVVVVVFILEVAIPKGPRTQIIGFRAYTL